MEEKELSRECAPEEQETPKRPIDMTFEELTALLDEVYRRTLSPASATEAEGELSGSPATVGDAENEQPDPERDPETEQVEEAEEELREFLESLNPEERNAFFTRMAERFGDRFEEIVALIEELDPSFKVDQEEEVTEETEEIEFSASDSTFPDAPQNGIDEAIGERIIPPPYSVVLPPYTEPLAQADTDDTPNTEQTSEGCLPDAETASEAPSMPLETHTDDGAESIERPLKTANTPLEDSSEEAPSDDSNGTESPLLDDEARSAADSLSQALQTVLESCEKLRSVYRACGFCQSCGGKFKGIFRRVCRQCGKPKDYKGPSFFKRLAARRALRKS